MELTIVKDTKELERLEGIIHKNLQSFYEVGKALAKIRDGGLYKIKNGGEYGTFEDYCKGVWDMGINYSEKLMKSATVMKNIESSTIVLPTTESQARPLAKLEPDQQREAWSKAVETAPEGKVTARHITKIIKEMTTTETMQEQTVLTKKKQTTNNIVHSDAMYFVGIAISQLERIRDDDPLREGALSKVMQWINKNKKGETH